MKISIIIATRNRPIELDECLDSIEKQDNLPDEVLIVDSSANNQNHEIIKKYSKINIKHYDYFEGAMEKARNHGIKNASGDIIAFIDDDVILPKSYCNEILDYFSNNGDVGAITGPTYDLRAILFGQCSDFEMNNLLNDNDPFFKRVVKEIETFSKKDFNYFFQKHNQSKLKNKMIKIYKSFFFLDSFQVGKMLPSGFGSDFSSTYHTYDLERLYGCNMVFRKEVLEEFCFDENLEKISNYAIYEDHEMAYRVSRKYRISMVPTLKLFHKKTPTDRVNFATYYKAIVVNVNYIVNKDLGKVINKIAFIWALFGAMFALSLVYLVKQNHENRDKLKGMIDGFNWILTNKL